MYQKVALPLQLYCFKSVHIPKQHAVREILCSRVNLPASHYFQWNEFGPSAGLTTGFGLAQRTVDSPNTVPLFSTGPSFYTKFVLFATFLHTSQATPTFYYWFSYYPHPYIHAPPNITFVTFNCLKTSKNVQLQNHPEAMLRMRSS